MVSNHTAASLLGRIACLSVAFTVLPLLAGCGSGGSAGAGSSGGGITPTAPTITWPTPAAITYGAALSATQLDATASVPGTFTYTPAAGTVPKAGTQTLTAEFVPADTKDYTGANATVQLTVNQAVPTISALPSASAITTAQTLASSTLTGGTAMAGSTAVAGTFAWTAPATSFTAYGTFPEGVTFTPTDATDYASVTGMVSVTVNPTTPQITSLTPRYATADANIDLAWSVTCAGCVVGDLYEGTGASGDSNPIAWPSSAETQTGNSMYQIGGDFEPAWFTNYVCDPNGNNCGNQYSTVFLGTASQSTLASAGPSGPLYEVQQTTEEVYSESVGGTSSLFEGTKGQAGQVTNIAIDDMTGNLILVGAGQADMYQNGKFTCFVNSSLSSSSSVAARGGMMAFPGPADNKVGIASAKDCSGFISVAIAGQPWAVAMTDGTAGQAIYVLSRDKGADALPTLTKLNFAGQIQGKALDLQNVIPVTTVRANCPNCGLWQVAALQNQKIATVLYMSTQSDGVIVFVDTDTMTATGTASVSGVLPTLIVPDDVNNTFWVEYIAPAGGDSVAHIAEANPASATFIPNKGQFSAQTIGGMVMTTQGLVGAMDSQFTAPVAVAP